MAFRPIPDLPTGFTIEQDPVTNLYIYHDRITRQKVFLTNPPSGTPLPDGWFLTPIDNRDGHGPKSTLIRKDGVYLPFYSDPVEYNHALQSYFNNICPEPIRDPRHVTIVIHNTENNTFLIGNENVYAQDGAQREIGAVKFSNFMTYQLLRLHEYCNSIRNILAIIGVPIEILNRQDIFPVLTPQEVPITNDLINNILNRIAKAIQLVPELHTRYHVKKVLTNPIKCSEIIIMQIRTWGRIYGFPKGAVERIDTINEDGVAIMDNTAILLNAARREVREEVRFNYTGPIQHLGAITLGDRVSHVCYIPINNDLANIIMRGYMERSITSELFNINFVNCRDLMNNRIQFNAYSQQIINEITGTQSITYGVGVEPLLFNICNIRVGGGKRRRKRALSRRHKKRTRKTSK